MANNERSFQTDLLHEMKVRRSTHCFKAMMAVMGGVPDIYVRDKEYGAFWIELKFERAPLRSTTRVPVKLTPLQRKFIRDEQAAGGVAGWCVCVKHQNGNESIYASSDAACEFISADQFVSMKVRGGCYNVSAIYRQIRATAHPQQNAAAPRMETDEA